ncbi:MAG: hypothetical protein IT177_07755 [Acidobacteria bacterium]|nr:hypothetical protein [Acidobacteriota bacterium]
MLHAAVLLLVMFLTGPATAQSLTDAEVDAAIAAGQNRKLKDLIADCTAKPGFGSAFGSAMAGGLQPSGAYDVSFATSAGRVALHAAQAKRLYKPFTRDDVTSDMRQPALWLWVEPQAPVRNNSEFRVASPLERVVLRVKDDEGAVLQPEDMSVEPVAWQNLLGAEFEGTRALVSFDLAAVRGLKPGNLEAVLVTQAGERRCAIGTKERQRLLTAK